MSGGSYNYLFGRVSDAADQVRRSVEDIDPSEPVWGNGGYLPPDEARTLQEARCAERLWFAGLLKVVSDAMKAIEWVDSCDTAPGRELEPIRAARAYIGEEAP